MQTQNLTRYQNQLISEFVETYNLNVEQISFEGESTEPIFDYEALNVLRLTLTDIQAMTPEIVERNAILNMVTVKCTATLADGRTAADLGTAQVGEKMFDGSTVRDFIKAEQLALARAFRRTLRSAGINLLKAHRQFLETGEIVSGDVDEEFNSKIGKEIHALANQWGHIRGKDKSGYQNFIENVFGTGKRSTLDLNDIQKSQLVNMYRQLVKTRGDASGIDETQLPKAA